MEFSHTKLQVRLGNVVYISGGWSPSEARQGGAEEGLGDAGVSGAGIALLRMGKWPWGLLRVSVTVL